MLRKAGSRMNAITSFYGDYRWLSNFHPVNIDAFGYTFGSVEAAYQAIEFEHALLQASAQAT